MKNGLKPCPFCGSDNIRLLKGMVSFIDYEIHCENCAVTGPNFGSLDEDLSQEKQNRQDAIDHWNGRV
jgi:Lar family restriction alleviation protein